MCCVICVHGQLWHRYFCPLFGGHTVVFSFCGKGETARHFFYGMRGVRLQFGNRLLPNLQLCCLCRIPRRNRRVAIRSTDKPANYGVMRTRRAAPWLTRQGTVRVKSIADRNGRIGATASPYGGFSRFRCPEGHSSLFFP